MQLRIILVKLYIILNIIIYESFIKGTQKYNKIELNLIAFRQQDKNLRRF